MFYWGTWDSCRMKSIGSKVKRGKKIYCGSENVRKALKLTRRIPPYPENLQNVTEVSQNSKHFRTETVTYSALTLTNSGSVM